MCKLMVWGSYEVYCGLQAPRAVVVQEHAGVAVTDTHIPHLQIAEADRTKLGAHLCRLISQAFCVALAKPPVGLLWISWKCFKSTAAPFPN